MELIRWSGEERFLRVGLIAPASPAEGSGLRMHEIETAINGLNGLGVFKLKSTSELTRNLLREKDLYKKLRSDKFPAVPYLFNIRNEDSVKGGPMSNCSQHCQINKTFILAVPPIILTLVRHL